MRQKSNKERQFTLFLPKTLMQSACTALVEE